MLCVCLFFFCRPTASLSVCVCVCVFMWTRVVYFIIISIVLSLPPFCFCFLTGWASTQLPGPNESAGLLNAITVNEMPAELMWQGKDDRAWG